MISKILTAGFFIILTYLLQASLVGALPEPLRHLSLPVVAIILVTYIFGWNAGFIWSICLSSLMDQDTHLLMSSTLLSFLITILIVKLLSDNVFTNRSLYSNCMLCLVGTAAQASVFYLINIRYFQMNLTPVNFIKLAGWQILLDLIVSAIVFTFLSRTYRGLKSYLLNE